MPGTKAPESTRREQILRAAYEVAAREGLDGTTVLQVAAEAGLSPGLVLFHFKTKRQLLLALLDWLLATTTVLHVGEDVARLPSPHDRLVALRGEPHAQRADAARPPEQRGEDWLGLSQHDVRRRRGQDRLPFRPQLAAVRRDGRTQHARSSCL